MTFEEIRKEALQRISRGTDKDSVINFIVTETGKYIGHGSVVSILLLDEQGLLRNGYSPLLPLDYLRAIDGIKPDPELGTCAAAAATGEMVITSDFHADSKWAELKHLPLSIGYRGAWSVPIKGSDDCVIGTFGTYLTDTRVPSVEEIDGTRLMAKTVASIIGHEPFY